MTKLNNGRSHFAIATNFIGKIGVFGRNTFICRASVPKRIKISERRWIGEKRWNLHASCTNLVRFGRMTPKFNLLNFVPVWKKCKNRHIWPIILKCTWPILTKFSASVYMYECGDDQSDICFKVGQVMGHCYDDNQLNWGQMMNTDWYHLQFLRWRSTKKLEYRHLDKHIKNDDDSVRSRKNGELHCLVVYLCMVTGGKSSYRSSFVMLAFQNALDDVDGHIKSGDDPCKIYLNLVGSKSGVNATQLSTAGLDRHLI